ncbi:MAG: dTDP-4-dehydrorhamnose reductase [Chloroflexi bacterium]|nr:dTDP-4-dehydrorhamnose reductase [Chloroflexota bacterium]MCL5273663.1 dTDP-4-dehydrorhamnose reductase [Chloroflexota bacterium]
MKIILIGANGQLGTDLYSALAQHDVVAAIQPGTPAGRLSPVFELDIGNGADVRAALAQYKPDVVINTAAFHRVDDIERDASIALQVNALAAQQLALACRDPDAALLHISTDYVFDGARRTPYVETDPPNPISAYGATKLAGELLVRLAWRKHYIIRPCGLYGTAGAMGKGGNFVNTMLRLAHEGKPIKVIDDQICTPTYTKDLAEQIALLITTGHYGTYHTTSDGACSWYEFACEIFRLAGLSVQVTPITSEEFGAPARRPAYSVLENRALRDLGIDRMRDWHNALAEYVAIVESGYAQSV